MLLSMRYAMEDMSLEHKARYPLNRKEVALRATVLSYPMELVVSGGS